jgi:moderate conductance mechanosensitive channel
VQFLKGILAGQMQMAEAAAPNPAPTLVDTVMAHSIRALFHQDFSIGTRILLILVLAVFANVLIRVIGLISEWLVEITQKEAGRRWFFSRQQKLITLVRLVANTLTWGIYFIAMGLVLEECGINLKAYLASASVVALAISFGSQGLVQDMVIGLTLIFSDAMDVDDMVEVVGSAVVVGRVQEIGLRFTKVVNLYNQVVFIPNRTVANVSRFPHGGIYAYADVQIPAHADRAKVLSTIKNSADDTWQQFAGIILMEPTIDPAPTSAEEQGGFVRVRFMIWPGQGGLIETTFRQRILSEMKVYDPAYADWCVPVFYRAMKSDRHPKTAP